MNKKSGKANIFLLLGICIILLTVVAFIYKTVTNYNSSPKDIGAGPEKSSQETSTQENIPVINNNDSSEEESYTRLMSALENKSILMVIAYKDFRDEEYLKTSQLFYAAGATVKVASTEKGIALGADGNTVEIDVLIKDANPADYDAVVFIGGPGALTYLDNQDSYKLARETIADNKVLGGICISPVVLAKAGVLKGKKTTVWTSSMDKSAVKILEENGAIFQDKPVIVDGRIITGNGPDASDDFAMKIIEVLTNI